MFRVAVLILLCCLLVACEESKETAREKLQAMGYHADGSGFVAMMLSGDRSPEMAERFIKAGVSPLAQSEGGENALIASVVTGDSELFERFVAYLPESGEGAQKNPVNMKDSQAKTALIHAVEQGRKQMVEVLLGKGADIRLFDVNVNTPVHHAVMRGDAEILRVLLEHISRSAGSAGQVINATNHLEQTPLLLAIEKGNQELALLLLEAGGDPNIANRRNYTPLMSASNQGNEALVSALLGKSAEVNTVEISGGTALIYALKGHADAIVTQLLEAGADPDIFREGDSVPLQMVMDNKPFNQDLFALTLSKSRRARANPYELLQYAVLAGRAEIVRVMLESGADVNRVGAQGESLLYTAIDKGRTEITLMLLAHGADISLSGSSNVLPLEAALRRGNHEVIRALLEKGANPDVKTNEGYSLAEMAVYRGFPEALDLLLSKGVRLNKDFSLLWSIRDGGGKAVPILLQYGANPNIMNQKGESALLLAAAANQLDAVNALIAHQASVDQGGEKLALSPLAAAAGSGYLEVTKALVDGGADINLRDKNGMTPVAHAAASLRAEVFSYLVEKGAALDIRDNMGRSIADMVAVASNSQDKQRILKVLAENRSAGTATEEQQAQ